MDVAVRLEEKLHMHENKSNPIGKPTGLRQILLKSTNKLISVWHSKKNKIKCGYASFVYVKQSVKTAFKKNLT